MRIAIIGTMLLCSPVSAQVVYPPVDTAAVAAAAAQAATTTAQQAAAALVPPTCTQPPAPDATAATAGVAAPCTPRQDAARQTPVPPASAVTVSGGGFSGTWPMALASPPTRALATVEGPTPYHCQIITKTATAFTGKCWLVNTSSNLPSLATSLLGYTVPLLVDAASGIQVTILARQ